jgi:hypothetical protein
MSVEEAIQPGEPQLPRRMPMRPPRGSTWMSWTCALLCLTIGVDLMHMFAEIDKAHALADLAMVHGELVPAGVERFNQAVRLSTIIIWILFVLFVCTTVVALRSLSELYLNLHRLRVGGLTYSPDEAKALFLKPFPMYQWMPLYRSIQEIWRASDPSLPHGSNAWNAKPYSWLVRLWWLLFWLRFVRINVSIQPFPAPTSAWLTLMQVASWVTVAACSLGAIAGVLFIIILVRIERRQWQRYDSA